MVLKVLFVGYWFFLNFTRHFLIFVYSAIIVMRRNTELFYLFIPYCFFMKFVLC